MKRAAWMVVGALLVGASAAPALAQQTLSPERWEETIRQFEAADREGLPEAGAVVFVGSSSIRFWSTLAEDFPSIHTVNRGFGGSGMDDLVHYAHRIVIPYRPGHVVVYTGENDLARGGTADDVFAAYREFVRRVHAELPETPITFVSMKPSPSREHLLDEMRRGNAMVREYSRNDARLGYIDVFEPMLDDEGRPREELFVADMLHLNEAGYALWKEILSPYVE